MQNAKKRGPVIALFLASLCLTGYLTGCGVKSSAQDEISEITSAVESVPTEAPRTEGTTQGEVTTVVETTEAPQTPPAATTAPLPYVVNPKTDEDVPASKPATVETTLKPETPPQDFEFNTSKDLHEYLTYFMIEYSIATLSWSENANPDIEIGLEGDDPTALQEFLNTLPIDHSWYEIRTNAPSVVPK